MLEFEKESSNNERVALRSGIGKWGGVRHGLIVFNNINQYYFQYYHSR